MYTTAERSCTGSRSEDRRRGCSTQTRQASASIRILYQLQNRHKALESRSLLPSSSRNAQTTPAIVRARSVAKSLSRGHCTNLRLRSPPLAVTRKA